MAGSREVHASALKDSLIDGMSFGSRPTASYILRRSSVGFPPQSGGTFEPGVLKIMRFSLQDAADGGSSGWLDGSTLRLAYALHNKSNGNIYFVPDQPICTMRRVRVTVGGVECHDIQDYGRVVQMFSNLLPPSRKMNDVIEGFGSATRPQIVADRSYAIIPKIKQRNSWQRISEGIVANSGATFDKFGPPLAAQFDGRCNY